MIECFYFYNYFLPKTLHRYRFADFPSCVYPISSHLSNDDFRYHAFSLTHSSLSLSSFVGSFVFRHGKVSPHTPTTRPQRSPSLASLYVNVIVLLTFSSDAGFCATSFQHLVLVLLTHSHHVSSPCFLHRRIEIYIFFWIWHEFASLDWGQF